MPELDPIFVSVKQAAAVLGLATWTVYKLLDAKVIESRYAGTRRLVDYQSLKDYAAGLPTAPAEPVAWT